jgi:hypothetical protein
MNKFEDIKDKKDLLMEISKFIDSGETFECKKCKTKVWSMSYKMQQLHYRTEEAFICYRCFNYEDFKKGLYEQV